MNEFSLLFPNFSSGADLWETLAGEKRPVVVYGMGNGADKLFSRLAALGVPVADVVASDGFVRGQSFHGMRVRSFSEVLTAHPDAVFLVSFGTGREDVLSFIEKLQKEHPLYIPDMPLVGDEWFDRAFCLRHEGELHAALSLFSDETSRRTFLSVLRGRLSGRFDDLMAETAAVADIYGTVGTSVRTVVDLGAYNGDTVREAAGYFPDLSVAVAVEPDGKTYRKLSAYAAGETRFFVRPVHAAAWHASGTGTLHGSDNRNSSLAAASFRHTDADVSLVTVDELCLDLSVDYIKYDVEGAEREALLGSLGTIGCCRPTLRVSLYHRSADLFSLPLFLAEKFPFYRFFLRRKRCLPAWELDLIARPERKESV